MKVNYEQAGADGSCLGYCYSYRWTDTRWLNSYKNKYKHTESYKTIQDYDGLHQIIQEQKGQTISAQDHTELHKIMTRYGKAIEYLAKLWQN